MSGKTSIFQGRLRSEENLGLEANPRVTLTPADSDVWRTTLPSRTLGPGPTLARCIMVLVVLRPQMSARAALHQELAFPACRGAGEASRRPGNGKDGDCSATLRPRWAVQTQSGESRAMEAVPTSLQRGREWGHGGGPCLRDEAGKNASG